MRKSPVLVLSAALVPLILAHAAAQSRVAPTNKRPVGATAQSPKPAAPAPASVASDPTLADLAKPVTSRNSLQAVQTRTITLPDRGAMTLGAVAAEAFAGSRSLSTEFQRSRAALAADPQVTEEVLETADETIFLTKTRITVVDPAKLSDKLAAQGLRPTTAKRKRTVAALSATEKTELLAIKSGLASLPASHPLKAAAARSDQELLDAVSSGKGDVTLTTTSRVSKASRIGAVARGPVAGRSPTTEVKTGGTKTRQHNFLDGDTYSFELVKTTWRWDFPGGFFSLTVDVSAGVGLRIPVIVTATTTPTSVASRGSADRDATFTTKFGVNVGNAGQDYFTALGLTPAQAFSGNEFVATVNQSVKVKLRFLGQTLIEENLAAVNSAFAPSYTASANFHAPLGKATSGLDVWLPANMTGTTATCCLDKLVTDQMCLPNCSDNKVTGSLQLGFEVSGTGTVGLTYEALTATNAQAPKQVIPSSVSTGSPTSATRLTFEQQGSESTVSALLSAASAPGTSSFGYRVSDVTYRWSAVFVPMLKETISVATMVYDNSWSLDQELPMWAFATKARTFSAHPGTPSSVEAMDGTKTFTRTALPQTAMKR